MANDPVTPFDDADASHQRSFAGSSFHVKPRSLSWQASLKQAIRSKQALCDYLHLDVTHRQDEVHHDFPLFVTREYADRIRQGDWNDPLLRQVWPDDREAIVAPGDLIDPVGDHEAEVLPGLLHKYHGRVLFIASGACAIHCRYCFRRHFPYDTTPKHLSDWEPAFDYIAKDRSIAEVILSGGDPLMLVDQSLRELIGRLQLIPHVERLRIHTRLPVVLPPRVTDDLLATLGQTRLGVWIVLHINHPNEIDAEVAEAAARLRQHGAILLNQSVLLKDVNDNAETLLRLSHRLLENGILPYYLHQLDRVRGAAHFETDDKKALHLVETLARSLPGFGVPRLVREIAGESHKTTITREFEALKPNP